MLKGSANSARTDKNMDVTTAYYFKGVAIGLTIAWVTSAIANYRVGQLTKGGKDNWRLLLPLNWTLVAFELVLSVIFLIVSYAIG